MTENKGKEQSRSDNVVYDNLSPIHAAIVAISPAPEYDEECAVTFNNYDQGNGHEFTLLVHCDDWPQLNYGHEYEIIIRHHLPSISPSDANHTPADAIVRESEK